MKKRLGLIFILCIFFSVSLFSQTNSVKTWSILYKKSLSIAEKKNKIIQIASIATTDFSDFIKDVLTEEADYPEIKDIKERKTFNEWVYNTILIADTLKITAATPLLQRLYFKVDEPRYKGEIIFTIGKLGDRSTIPWLNAEMNVMNDLHRDGKIKGKEEIVDGLVRSLSLFHDPSSFEELFYASIPNYSDKIRKQAADGLAKITNEPATLCADYIRTETDYNLIAEALKYAYKSASKTEDKILAVKNALLVTIDVKTTPNQTIAELQRKIRDDSVTYLAEFKTGDDETVKLIARKWDMDKNSISNIITIEALQKIGSDAAVNLLREKLAYLTLKTKEGAGTGFGKDEAGKIVISIVRALGSIGNPSALEELMDIKTTVEFGKPVIDEVDAAIKKLSSK